MLHEIVNDFCLPRVTVMNTALLVQQLEAGVSPLQLLDILIDKSLETLAIQRDDEQDYEKFIATVDGIGVLFSTLTADKDKPEHQQQQSAQAARILQNVCGEFLKSLYKQLPTDYDCRLQQVSATVVAELCVSVSPSLVKEDLEVLKKIIDISLNLLQATDHVASHDDHQQTAGSTTDDHMFKHISVTFLSVLFNSNSVLPRLFAFSPEYDDKVLQILLSVLRISSVTLCYHITGQLLPCLIQQSALPSAMAESVWEFICSVWLNKTTVETNSLDASLTMLCCLHHFYINASTSLFSPPPPPPPPPGNDGDGSLQHCMALIDVRVKKSFWRIVQIALVDTNPLSRKRGAFLLHKVLHSVDMLPAGSGKKGKREGNFGTGHSEGCVFWWGCGSDEEHKEMQSVWEGVVLLLETLEEKQASDNKINYSIVCQRSRY